MSRSLAKLGAMLGRKGPVASCLPGVRRLSAIVLAGVGLVCGMPAQADTTSPDLLYFSTSGSTSVPGVPSPYDDADIYRFDVATGSFDRVFDASNAGLPGNADIDALHVVDPVTFYLSFNRDEGTTVPGLGLVMDEDVVLYHAGTFSWALRGSAVGLGDDGNGEDIDGLHLLPDGSALISTIGTPKVAGVYGATKHDILLCKGTLGAQASCSWSMYLDGSTVGLSLSDENIDAVFETDGDLYFSTTGPFSVAGLSGGNGDVSRCDNTLAGAPINCERFDKFFDGSSAGLLDNLDAAHFARDAFADPVPATFRIVVLGSSTARGTGASAPDKAWSGLLDAWLNTVTASHEIVSLSVGGATTKSFRPDEASTSTDVNRSITRALELNPDLVIVNLPSNNVAAGIPVSTTIWHYRQIKAAADEQGVPLLLTTTQPRNFTDLSLRAQLQDEAVAVRMKFGTAVIDVYDELTDFGNNLAIRKPYDSGDGVHLNDAGHAYLFQTMQPRVAAYVTP